MKAGEPPVTRVRWRPTWRIIPSRYPPVQVFERIADPADWDRLAQLEMLTNPRLRQAWGEISLVPPERRVAGPGASFAMAPFVHPNPRGSRFSDGSFGVYYAARRRETAIAETTFHMGGFYAETADPPHREDMRVLLGKIDARLHDIRGGARWRKLHDPDDYAAAQALGAKLREAGANGIAYDSVRHAGGENIAAFWPDVVGAPVQGPHLQYEWDGTHIRRYFDYAIEQWFEVNAA